MSFRKKMKKIVEENDTKIGRYFDIFIQFLIFLSLISFTIETLPDLDTRTIYILKILEIITVIVFSLEYLLRIWVSERRLRFIFSFYGLIDLFAILPFYLATSVDLRSIRIFRVFRMFRTLKLLRYSKAIKLFRQVFIDIKEELLVFFLASVIVLYVSAVGIYYFENAAQPEAFKSVFHSLWWAVATLTTVGYGDIFPITVGGKIFTYFILMVGLGVIAVPTGLISSALTKINRERKQNNEVL